MAILESGMKRLHEILIIILLSRGIIEGTRIDKHRIWEAGLSPELFLRFLQGQGGLFSQEMLKNFTKLTSLRSFEELIVQRVLRVNMYELSHDELDQIMNFKKNLLPEKKRNSACSQLFQLCVCFGEALAVAMDDINSTVDGLSRDCGIKALTLWKYLRGSEAPGSAAAKLLAKDLYLEDKKEKGRFLFLAQQDHHWMKSGKEETPKPRKLEEIKKLMQASETNELKEHPEIKPLEPASHPISLEEHPPQEKFSPAETVEKEFPKADLEQPVIFPILPEPLPPLEAMNVFEEMVLEDHGAFAPEKGENCMAENLEPKTKVTFGQLWNSARGSLVVSEIMKLTGYSNAHVSLIKGNRLKSPKARKKAAEKLLESIDATEEIKRLLLEAVTEGFVMVSSPFANELLAPIKSYKKRKKMVAKSEKKVLKTKVCLNSNGNGKLLGRFLGMCREMANLSQSNIANILGIPEEELTKVERGKVPHLTGLVKLIKACGLDETQIEIVASLFSNCVTEPILLKIEIRPGDPNSVFEAIQLLS
jgi:predicted transcriptional regulator